MTTERLLRIAFSPDSDDIFMFWPLLNGKVPTEGLTFEHERADTESLNARADRDDVDVLAVSAARYAQVTDRWMLLASGASVGRGYGPVVVAAPSPAGAMTLAELAGKRVGIPGLRTTAYLALQAIAPSFTPVVLPIAPYSRVFDALRSGEVDAALVIHEGRLLYEREGFAPVVDVGVAWSELTGGLPLPLGVNVVRRGLGPELVARACRVCDASVAWALGHRDEVMDALLADRSRTDLALDRATLDRYLAMYANEDTRSLADDVRLALDELFARGRRAGLVPEGARVEVAR